MRRAAIQALEAIIFNTEGATASLTPSDLQVFYDGCMDASLAIRKQSLSSISKLLRNRVTDVVLQKCWLGAVLPLVTDRENTVQDATLDFIDELILQPIARACK